MAPKKKPKEGVWQNSRGQTLLWRDVRDGTIPATMEWETAYLTRPEFAVGKTPEEAERLFQGRLTAARKRNNEKQNRADEEKLLMEQDRLTCPPPATNHRGEPRWHGSAAEMVLKDDVANGVHLGMAPADYYNLRPEFLPFYASTIAGHVIQEEKLRKFNKQYKS